jgi:hypothetical protein
MRVHGDNPSLQIEQGHRLIAASGAATAEVMLANRPL